MNDLRADLASLKIDRSGPKPPNKLLRALLVLAAVGGIVFVGLRVGRPFVEDKLFQVEVAATEITTLSPSQAAVDLTSTGYVVPQLTAKVSANVIGRVTRSNAKEGQRVKLGDLLFELDSSSETALFGAPRMRVRR
jgi:multidrug efflux pump subunit AcrA (membrane-fusion protein)